MAKVVNTTAEERKKNEVARREIFLRDVTEARIEVMEAQEKLRRAQAVAQAAGVPTTDIANAVMKAGTDGR